MKNMENQQQVLQISHAHKFYNRGRSNEIHVMDDINLELPSRGMIAIFGKSGCGKTTLLNAVGGLDKIQSGTIRIFGEDLQDHPDVVRNKHIGYIFQNYNLNVGETVYENVADALYLCGVESAEEIQRRVMSSLRNVGMDKYKDRTPDTLSGGQQQRVAIARAICKGPAIILADEPTGNLDENNTVLVMDILKEISKTRLVLLVTHEANLVDYYCDRVIEIVDGRIVGTKENSQANGYVQKNKNDIYLGELTKTTLSSEHMTLEAFSDQDQMPHVSLKLISSGGKLYIKCETPGVRVLDDSSEVKLREGCFQAQTDSDKPPHTQRQLDMTVLSPVEGKHFGRLYHAKNATVMAWRDNYSQRKKKGRRFLQVCLLMLSAVLVVMSAVSSRELRTYLDLRERNDDHMFYVPLDLASGYEYNALLKDHLGQDGIDYVMLTDTPPEHAEFEMYFHTAAFMTADVDDLVADGVFAPRSMANGYSLVCGTDGKNRQADILITTALADELIESSTASYIKSYENLIGLVSAGKYSEVHLRIAGVVESDERYAFLDDVLYADTILGYYNMLAPASLQSFWTDKVAPGQVVVSTQVGKQVGDIFTLFGKDFTVAHVMNTDDAYDMQENDVDIVLNDEDYASLMQQVGPSDALLGKNTFFYKGEDTWSGQSYYSHYMKIHSSDPAATEAYLMSTALADQVITPEDVFDLLAQDHMSDIVGSGISVLVVIGFMCLCVFFIMRSSFMSRVREIGILRAIGVSKKNITFRFFVETALLTVETVGLGYGLSSLLIAYLSDAPLFNRAFYFPFWMGAGLAILLFAVMFIFGLLPLLLLLRKTPSEILAKYDM